MTDTAQVARFWQIVQVCLEELYHFSGERAAQEIARLKPRGKAMHGLGKARDMTYHAQPLHVACNIAQDDEPMDQKIWSDYQAILARLGGTESAKEAAAPSLRKPAQTSLRAEHLKVAASR